MYWWNYKKLAWALREKKVTLVQETNYWIMFVLQLVFVAVVAYGAVTVSGTVSAVGIVNNLVLPVSFLIVWYLVGRKVNRQGDNVELVKRFICLSLPLCVQVTTLMMLVQVAGIYQQMPGLLNGDLSALENMKGAAAEGTWWQALVGVAVLAYSVKLMDAAMKIASGQTAARQE